ncbi:MAG: hypothetical protein HQK96_20025 [Nitrospirae bacterium]|nr:hypothetical protein [Nitrospirota bacterium]
MAPVLALVLAPDKAAEVPVHNTVVAVPVHNMAAAVVTALLLQNILSMTTTTRITLIVSSFSLPPVHSLLRLSYHRMPAVVKIR